MLRLVLGMAMRPWFLTGGLLLCAILDARAQSMSPMRAEVTSYSDEFAVRVFPRNPYQHAIPVSVHVYDQDFKPIAARVSPFKFRLGAGGSRTVLVIVSFEGKRERRIRICTESVPFADKEMNVRAKVCGRFIARRLS